MNLNAILKIFLLISVIWLDSAHSYRKSILTNTLKRILRINPNHAPHEYQNNHVPAEFLPNRQVIHDPVKYVLSPKPLPNRHPPVYFDDQSTRLGPDYTDDDEGQLNKWRHFHNKGKGNEALASVFKSNDNRGNSQAGHFTVTHHEGEFGRYDASHISAESSAVSGPRTTKNGALVQKRRNDKLFDQESKAVEGSKHGPFYLKAVSKANVEDLDYERMYENDRKKSKLTNNSFGKKSSRTRISTTLSKHSKTAESMVTAQGSDAEKFKEKLQSSITAMSTGSAQIASDGSLSTSANGAFGSSSSAYDPATNYEKIDFE